MAAGTFKTLQKSVAAAGTAESIYAAGSLEVSELSVKAKSTNTGLIFIGNSSVDSSNGYILAAGESFSFSNLLLSRRGAVTDDPFIDMNTVYIDSGTNGDGVSVAYIERNNG